MTKIEKNALLICGFEGWKSEIIKYNGLNTTYIKYKKLNSPKVYELEGIIHHYSSLEGLFPIFLRINFLGGEQNLSIDSENNIIVKNVKTETVKIFAPTYGGNFIEALQLAILHYHKNFEKQNKEKPLGELQQLCTETADTKSDAAKGPKKN